MYVYDDGITDELIETMKQEDKICNYIDIPIQHVADPVLKGMRRKSTGDSIRKTIAKLRKEIPDIHIRTTILVGFPGETEEEFAESKAFVDKVDFYETHIFKYSRREGTKAAAMKDQVPDQIKAARSAELLELNRKKQAIYEERLLGTTQEVLIEEKIVRDGEELQIGHTKEYVKIGVKNPNNLINQLVNVEIENQLQILH